MIHAISLHPYIEKRIRGFQSEMGFNGKKFTYLLNSTAIETKRYLKSMGYDCWTYGMIGTNAYPLVKDELRTTDMIMQSNINTDMKIIMIDQNEETSQVNPEPPLADTKDIAVFYSLAASNMQPEDVVLLEQTEKNLDIKSFKSMFDAFKNKSKIICCYVDPKYYPVFNGDPANILVVDQSQLIERHHLTGTIYSNDLIELIKENYLDHARIIVLMISSSKMIAFHDGKVYLGKYLLKDKSGRYYPAAVMSSLADCYYKQGDIDYLLRSALTYSIGASLSEGIYQPTREALDAINGKIEIMELENNK